MSKNIESNDIDFIAFFTNNVDKILTEDLSQKVKLAITESISEGKLDKDIPIAVTVNEETLEITLLNVMLEELDLNVVPGSVTLPSNYMPSENKTSLVNDPIWSKHMESVWGF